MKRTLNGTLEFEDGAVNLILSEPTQRAIVLEIAARQEAARVAAEVDHDRLARTYHLGAEPTRLRPLLLDALTTELLRLIEAERAAPVGSPAPCFPGARCALRPWPWWPALPWLATCPLPSKRLSRMAL